MDEKLVLWKLTNLGAPNGTYIEYCCIHQVYSLGLLSKIWVRGMEVSLNMYVQEKINLRGFFFLASVLSFPTKG